MVEKKMANVIERDAMKIFQSPVRGAEIMAVSGLKEGRKIGKIKKAIEEAILDCKIDNTHEAALRFLMEIKDNYIKEST